MHARKDLMKCRVLVADDERALPGTAFVPFQSGSRPDILCEHHAHGGQRQLRQL
jgi:hypothetical protein